MARQDEDIGEIGKGRLVGDDPGKADLLVLAALIRCERCDAQAAGNGALDMPAEPNVIGKPVEVTTSMTQKMLSATTGSLMTSLLGMSRALSLLLFRDTRTHTDHPSQ